MINFLNFLKDFWFLFTFLGACFMFMFKQFKMFSELQKTQSEAIKCGLRNDILSIYDKCKKDKKITKYELQAIEFSYKSYKELNGNSFVDDIHRIVKSFKVID
jgi:hypothetical protein